VSGFVADSRDASATDEVLGRIAELLVPLLEQPQPSSNAAADVKVQAAAAECLMYMASQRGGAAGLHTRLAQVLCRWHAGQAALQEARLE